LLLSAAFILVLLLNICLPLEHLVVYIFLQSRLNEEQDRCNIYIDASTKKPLIATAETQLLERHISAILDKVQMPLVIHSFLQKGNLFSLLE